MKCLAVRKPLFGSTAKAQISLRFLAIWSGPLFSENRIIGEYTILKGEQMPDWAFAHVQDDVNPHILRMLESIFLLDATNMKEIHPTFVKQPCEQYDFDRKASWNGGMIWAKLTVCPISNIASSLGLRFFVKHPNAGVVYNTWNRMRQNMRNKTH